MLNFILTIDNLLITSKIKPILHYAVSYKSIKMIKDKTLVIGASDRNDKYSNIATRLLLHKYILKLKPIRILFNPGTENDELRKLAESAGIETEYACTLVLLNLNQY
jgi:ABC-type uncharacterized transport system substrate-binding protein